jgi:hypothetical protein
MRFPWIGSFPDHKVAKVWDPTLNKFIACGLRRDEHVPTTIIIKQEAASSHEAVTSPPPQHQEATMASASDIQKLLSRAENYLDADNMTAAENVMKAVERQLNANAVDDDEEDDGDDTRDEQLDGLDPDGEDADAQDNEDGDDGDDAEDDEEDDDEPVAKSYEYPYGQSSDRARRNDMYASHGDAVYPETQTHSPNTPKFLVRADFIRQRDGLSRNAAMQQARKEYPQDYATFQRWQGNNARTAKASFDPLAPRGRTAVHAPHPYRTATWPAVQAPGRSGEWDDYVDQIMRERGCTRTVALTQARQMRPDLYARYQGWLATDSAQVQQATRSTTDAAFKRAPCYEDLVAAEIRKGCNETVAAQRVLQLYGNATPPSFMAKGQDVVDRFQGMVAKIADEEGCGLLEATEIAARENPQLMKYLR